MCIRDSLLCTHCAGAHIIDDGHQHLLADLIGEEHHVVMQALTQPINSFSPTPKLFDDSQIPAFKALADSVHAYGTKLGIQIVHPEYDVDASNSLFMQKKFDEMRQRLHHDMMFFTDEVSEEMLMAIIDKM